MADPRVYQIEDAKDGTCVAAIIAKTSAQALNHHMKSMFVAKPMSAFDLHMATKHGMAVQDATEDPTEDPQAGPTLVNLPAGLVAKIAGQTPQGGSAWPSE